MEVFESLARCGARIVPALEGGKQDRLPRGELGRRVRLLGHPVSLGRTRPGEQRHGPGGSPRRPVGTGPEDPNTSLNASMSVGDFLAEPHTAGNVSREAERDRVADLLDQARLPNDAVRRRPPTLSDGQRQRVAIARALALDPCRAGREGQQAGAVACWRPAPGRGPDRPARGTWRSLARCAARRMPATGVHLDRL
ncbi:MAG: ATP-binding cassette domain-containing protein [Cellulomonas sp.]|uniref:ATP-binding cassette domain-containing protein n=1 Tax=Cellulomonas sp. TaxID=40001 RepID=UPI001820AC12|nr:ATP-binding cassette domain-containing protein [Cellulomonas sp.]NMM17551.1 ATP-binding cassette domain-containing protein [Cellulomonas sp.]NMM30527.1 ATP-binding cassette domain-containing protein [Cellulomonas sp.]